MLNSRKEFEHNIHLLSENRVNITDNSIRSIKGLKNARFAPNLRGNLNTVDESTRLMANTIAHMIQDGNVK